MSEGSDQKKVELQAGLAGNKTNRKWASTEVSQPVALPVGRVGGGRGRRCALQRQRLRLPALRLQVTWLQRCGDDPLASSPPVLCAPHEEVRTAQGGTCNPRGTHLTLCEVHNKAQPQGVRRSPNRCRTSSRLYIAHFSIL